jgi:hypothetical protein
LPNYHWHKTKCGHNLDTNHYLAQKTAQFFDWEIVTLFYCAVHAVDSFFATSLDPRRFPYRFRHPKEHGLRNKMVSKHLGPIANEYVLLYELGRTARYDSYPPISKKEVDDSTKAFNTISKYLRVP